MSDVKRPENLTQQLAPKLAQSLAGRLARLGLGLVLYGVSIALMLDAGLGVDSWDVFHQGIALLADVTFGVVAVAVSFAVLLLWVPLRQRPGFGTLANALAVGPVADLTLANVTSPTSLTGRLAMLALGIVLNGVATGMYIGAGLGPGPRDGLMTGLAGRTGVSIRSTRTLIELVVLGAGWAMGGPIGLGTVLYAVSIGPLTQFFMIRLSSEPGRPSSEETRPTLREPRPEVCI